MPKTNNDTRSYYLRITAPKAVETSDKKSDAEYIGDTMPSIERIVCRTLYAPNTTKNVAIFRGMFNYLCENDARLIPALESAYKEAERKEQEAKKQEAEAKK